MSILDNTLKRKALQGEDPIDKILEYLLECNFEEIRYFQFCPSDNEHQFSVLIREKRDNNINVEKHIGKKIRTKKTALYLLNNEEKENESNFDITILDKDSPPLNKELKLFHNDIGLSEKHQILIPLYLRNDLVGELTCSFNFSSSLINEEILHALKLVSGMVARYYRLASRTRLDKVDDQSIDNEILNKKSNKQDLLNDIAENIRSILDVESCSIFEMEPFSQRLYRVGHTCIGRLSFPENEIYERNVGIVGNAYLEVNKKYIYDINFYKENDLICENEGWMDSTHSYQAFEFIHHDENSYLLRIVNKAREPKLPFSLLDLRLLRETANRFSKKITDISNAYDLKLLANISIRAFQNIGNEEQILKSVAKGIRSHEVHEFIFIGQLESSSSITIYFDSINNQGVISDKSSPKVFYEERQTKFFKKCIESNDVAFISPEVKIDSIKDITGFIIIPVTGNSLRAAILIAVKNKYINESNFDQNIFGRIKIFKAYASILGNLLSLNQVKLNTSAANDLLGHIGHEIKTPANIIINLSREIISKVERLCNEITYLKNQLSGSLLMSFTDLKLKITEEGNALKNLIEISRGMTLSKETNISIRFEEISIFKLILDCEQIVRSELREHQGDRDISVTFHYNDALKKHRKVIADKFLLKKIFENLMRNAVKYSSPDKKRKMDIHINANPQKSMNIIQINNWGTPIHPNQFEKIFQPYFRGNVKDPHRANRGIGLGLYLVKMFANAHRGDILLNKSTPTLSNNEVRENHGWETQFELRFPTDLKSYSNSNIYNFKFD